MCWILETLIQSGWEISTSCMTNVTTGYDAGSYFLKKNSAPALHNAQVAAVGEYTQVVESRVQTN